MWEYTCEKSAMWNASKLQIPKEAHWWLRREKLLASIEGGDESAVVFHAGAGYGKTIVMAEWATDHQERSCWYRMHESDNHFYRFLYGIATALSGVVNADLFDVDRMKLTGRERPEQIGELFFSQCIPALPENGISICLDEFQVIHDETVQDFLLRFMEYGEGRVRLFFSSRGGFPGFLSACLMRGRVREVKADELRFEERETALLLEKMSGRKLPRQIVREIHADTRGWPAGIAFAGLDFKEMRTPPKPGSAELFDRTHLHDYIFYEIFRKLAYDTQQFLLETSVFETIKPSVCNYAMGREDAAGMLKYLVRENLFLSRIEGEEDEYRYDDVFRGFLRSRLPDRRRGEILFKAAEHEAREKPAFFVQCMGSFSVRGEVSEVAWRTKKTKELFACLFYERGRWVTRDVLTERLWPDKTAEKSVVLFHTTASYLRKALARAGGTECLLVKNQSYALDMTRMQSDMETLHSCYECLKSGKTLDRERAGQLISFYGQGYMYGEDYVWLGAYREHVEQRYLWMLQTLADRAFAEKEYPEAAAYLKKVVEVDGYAVSAMEQLVECLILCRNLTGAKRVYEQLKEVSWELLGEKPQRAFEEFVSQSRR